ncbi:MAG: AAA family ATPase [Cyanobacteria bacterium REEB67]|nr:AAA family ATPase [Cyanobacteria bacterium REEB67]
MSNTVTASQIAARQKFADSVLENDEATREQLLIAEDYYLEALEYRSNANPIDEIRVAYLHYSLGKLYARFDDRFLDGEVHFAAAIEGYKSMPDSCAIVANCYADLMVTKAKLILEESQDHKDDIAEIRPGSGAKAAGLSAMLSRGSRGKKVEVGAAEMALLRRLASTNEEAAECFRKADQFRLQAYNLQRKHAETLKEKVKKLEPTVAKSTSTALTVTAQPITRRSPAEIYAMLDKVAVGQQAAKRGLANAASQHINRALMTQAEREETDKANVLILGPTGCGKTLLVSSLAKSIGVPYYASDASKLTAAGYVGEDVQSLLEGLLRACNYDMNLAQNGIIYVDEIDKIAGHDMGGSKDVGGEAVQQELLTILEGTKIRVDGPSGKRGDEVEIDTTNILFIAGGAFVGLGDIVAQRVKSSKGTKIGFGATLEVKEEDKNHYQNQANAADFKRFGMIPEFIGRMPKRLFVEALTVEQLERILLEPKKALVAQKRLLLAATTDLRFTRGALRQIAEDAALTGTHGRALAEIMEAVLEPIIFEQPAIAIITAEMVKNRNAEIGGQNVAEERPAMPDFIVDDDTVEATMTVLIEAAYGRSGARRSTGRELVVRR